MVCFRASTLWMAFDRLFSTMRALIFCLPRSRMRDRMLPTTRPTIRMPPIAKGISKPRPSFDAGA